MRTISSQTSRYEVLPRSDGRCAVDMNRSGTADDGDAALVVKVTDDYHGGSAPQYGYVKFSDLAAAVSPGGQATGRSLGGRVAGGLPDLYQAETDLLDQNQFFMTSGSERQAFVNEDGRIFLEMDRPLGPLWREYYGRRFPVEPSGPERA